MFHAPGVSGSVCYISGQGETPSDRPAPGPEKPVDTASIPQISVDQKKRTSTENRNGIFTDLFNAVSTPVQNAADCVTSGIGRAVRSASRASAAARRSSAARSTLPHSSCQKHGRERGQNKHAEKAKASRRFRRNPQTGLRSTIGDSQLTENGAYKEFLMISGAIGKGEQIPWRLCLKQVGAGFQMLPHSFILSASNHA